MDKLKQWVALTVVGVLAVLAAGWFLLVAPKRSDASALSAQAQAQDSTNAGLRTALTILKAQAKAEPAQEAKLAAIAAKLPDNPALPALIRNLDKISASTGVDLLTLAPSAPTPVTAAVTATTAVQNPQTGRVVGAPARSAATPADGVLEGIAVSLTLTGSYFQGIEFVDGLESLSRAFKVTSLTITPGSVAASGSATSAAAAPSNKVSMTITGTVYLNSGRAPLAPVSIPKSGK